MGHSFAEVSAEKRVSYKVGDNNTPRVDIDGRLYTQELSTMTLQNEKNC
jgi:molecular chaperone DnaK